MQRSRRYTTPTASIYCITITFTTIMENTEMLARARPQAQLPHILLVDLNLPAPIVLRLEAQGIRTIADWLVLGRARFAIFGVVRVMVDTIDKAVAEVAK